MLGMCQWKAVGRQCKRVPKCNDMGTLSQADYSEIEFSQDIGK